MKILTLTLGLTAATALADQGLESFPEVPGYFNDIALDNPPMSGSKTQEIDVEFHFSCYRTNLRAVANPLAPYGCIDVGVVLKDHPTPVSVRIPATFISPTPGPANPNCTGYKFTPGTEQPGWDLQELPAQYPGEYTPEPRRYMLLAKTKMVVATMKVDPDGHFDVTTIPTVFQKANITQQFVGSGNFWAYGNDGTIYCTAPPPAPGQPDLCGATRGSGYSYHQVSYDGKKVIFGVSLPGAAYPGQGGGTGGKEWGFCGGYYSPLMVFLDDERPDFTGTSHFPLVPGLSLIHWPEPGAPGYFLALDRKGDGKIASGDQLFGANESELNGFTALAKLDKNRDGFVDAKDPLFGKLVLWRDENADGVSQKNEVIPLAKLGITRLPTKYDGSQVRERGQRAELREKAPIEYRDPKTGAKKKGWIVDVWLGPAHGPLAAQK